MVYILIVLGLMMGSFISALTWRLNKQPSTKSKTKVNKYSIVSGRSMCPNCSHQLGPIDLIPVVSWVLTGGKCRYCRSNISPQYPVIEIVTAVAFAISYLSWPFGLLETKDRFTFGLWLLSTVLFIALAVYDLRWMLLPDKLMSPLKYISLVAAINSVVWGGISSFQSIVWGVVIGFGFFYTLFVVSNGRWIGGGDVKFGLIMGLWLGSAKTVTALLLSFYSSAALILPLMLLGKISRKSEIPFGPFLIASTFISFLFGEQLIGWYETQFLAGLI